MGHFVRFWATLFPCYLASQSLPSWQHLPTAQAGGPKSDKIVWATNMTPFHKVTSVQLGQFCSLNFLHILLDQKTFFSDFLLLRFSQQTYYKSEYNNRERKNRIFHGTTVDLRSKVSDNQQPCIFLHDRKWLL